MRGQMSFVDVTHLEPSDSGSAALQDRTEADRRAAHLKSPLATTSNSIEIDLARRLGDLHQLLYTRGGIRPVNAAVEELSKLLLLEIAAERFPDLPVPSIGPLRSVVDPDRVTVEGAKKAFNLVVAHPDLAGCLPGGERQPVWPLDEPLRITRNDVLAEALRVLHRSRNTQGTSLLDPLGTAFDVFLSGKYEHAGGLGTHLTPTNVARAMTRIGLALLDSIDWTDGPIIADPCCGTGRFLVAALEEMRSRVGQQVTPTDLESFSATGLIGADQSPSSVAKARVNLLSYGIHQPEVFTVEDSVTDRSLDALRGQLKLILTNPPFGEGKYDSVEGIARTSRVFSEIAGRARIDPALAFMARCLDLLGEGGVVGIVLPDGIVEGDLFRSNIFDRPRMFGSGASIEAVVSLPSATFSLGGTTAKTSAVFVRRGLSTRRRLYFGRADHVGYVRQAGTAAVDPAGDELPTISDAIVCAIQQNGGGRTEVVRREPLVAAVARHDCAELDLASLDPDAIEARELLKAQGGVELQEFIRPVRRRRRFSVPENAPFISVLHVDDLGVVAWREARDYRPSTPGLTARTGEILVSLLNPRKFRATVIPDRYSVVQCSAEFGLFESHTDPYAVLALMQHPLVRAQIAPLGHGTSSSRRRIEPRDILRLLVPRRDPTWLAAAGSDVRDALERCAEAEDRLLARYSS